MNPLDIIIVCIVSYCLIRGIFRGLIKELSSIVGVVAGLYAARLYYPHISGLLNPWIANSGYRDIAGFFIIFCAVLIIVAILAVIIKYVMKIVSAGWLDRLLGSIFAAVKAVLIVSVILIALTAFLPRGAPVLKNSLLAPRVMVLSAKMVKLVPGHIKQEFVNKFNDLQKTWKRI